MERVKQRVAALGMAALGALGTGAVVASPAEAATACNARICVNEHANYGGAQHDNPWGGETQIYLEYPWNSGNVPHLLNNKISSIRNHDSVSWCFYDDVYRLGNKYQVYPAWYVSQVPAYINDTISLAVRGNCP